MAQFVGHESLAVVLTSDWESSKTLTPGARSDADPSFAVLGTVHGGQSPAQ